MEFADFDEDLFEEKPPRGSVPKDYQARLCEEGWFMEVKPDQLVSQEDELGVKKFAADYLYLNKLFDVAAVKYNEIMDCLPESSVTSRRECQENLARCHIKAGAPEMAVIHAEKLHSTSKTFDQLTVSYSLLMDVYLSAMKYGDALIAAQNLISLHPDNGHFWMKLGYVYACVKKITLPSVQQLLNAHLPYPEKSSKAVAAGPFYLHGNPPNCIQNSDQGGELQSIQRVIEQEKPRKDVLIVAACLHRAYYILLKTEGTAVGFAVSNTKFFKEKLQRDLTFLLDDCTLEELRHNIHQNDRAEVSSCSESEDFSPKENSKCKTDHKDVEKDISEEIFEEKWFSWIL